MAPTFRSSQIALVSYDPPDDDVVRVRLGSTSAVYIDGVGYAPVSEDEYGHVMRRLDNPLVVEGFSHKQVREYSDDGRLTEDESGLSVGNTSLALALPEMRLGDLPPPKLRTVLFRERLCREILQLEEKGECTRSDASLAVALRSIYVRYAADEALRQSADARCGTSVTLLNPPSPSTVRRWLRVFERWPHKPVMLLPGYGRSGNKEPRLPSEERTILRKMAARYANLRKPSQSSIHLEMRALVDRLNRMRAAKGLRPLRCPGRSALASAIAGLDVFHVFAAREGAETAKRKFQIVRGGLDVEAPLERIEIDECKLPLQVLLQDLGVWSMLDSGLQEKIKVSRVWASIAIDCRTRCILALLLIRNPNLASAMATLEMVTSDKSGIAEAAGCKTPWDMRGTPDTVATDSGSWFISDGFHACVSDLGAELFRPVLKTPRLRGTVERFFGTLHKGLIAYFDGRSFENVVAKGEYDSEGNATINLETLGKLLVRYTVDIYHNTPHAGLGGETPRACWLRLTRKFGVRLPPSSETRRHIFGTLLEGTITSSGLRNLGLQYQSTQLQRQRGNRIRATVTYKVDPLDVGNISVHTSAGWLTVKCRTPDMAGVTLEQYVAATLSLRRRFAAEAELTDEIVLAAVRDIRAKAEGQRRRAGIASPILSFDDYGRIEKSLFSPHKRAKAQELDAIAALTSVPIDDPKVPMGPKTAGWPSRPSGLAAVPQETPVEETLEVSNMPEPRPSALATSTPPGPQSAQNEAIVTDETINLVTAPVVEIDLLED